MSTEWLRLPRKSLLTIVTKAIAAGEPWAEPDLRLPLLEASTISDQLDIWHALRDRVLALLDLKAAFSFSATQHLTQLLQMEQAFIAASGVDGQAPILRAAFEAFVIGIERGRIDSGGDARVEAVAQAKIQGARERYRAHVRQRGLELVRNASARAYRERIIQALSSGEFDGENPRTVASKLRKLFDAGEYDWERLARSEMAMAQVDGKLAQYAVDGVERLDYVTAEDGRVSQICRGLAARGPYALDECPVPVRNSHPNCRCTVMPAAE